MCMKYGLDSITLIGIMAFQINIRWDSNDDQASENIHKLKDSLDSILENNFRVSVDKVKHEGKRVFHCFKCLI